MSRQTVRWIAIVVIAAMLGFVVVAAVAGGGDGGSPDETDRGGAAADAAAVSPTVLLDGPHVVVDLCNGDACPRQDDAAQQALADEIGADGRVASARLVTSEHAYELFLQEFGDNEELVAETDPADVPARIEIDLLDPADADALIEELGGRDGVLNAHPPSVPTR